MQEYFHQPVLVHEVVDLLHLKKNDNVIDVTVGGGGHAYEILRRTTPHGKLLACDLDPRAVEAAQQKLLPFGSRVKVIRRSFAELRNVLKQFPDFQPVAGILADLGVSSDQLQRGRGFSFRDRGLPDMRFDPDAAVSASDILMSASEQTLRSILAEFGEVRHARALAREIVRTRHALQGRSARKDAFTIPMLVTLVMKYARLRPHGIHPATQVFQALRIAVNRELETLLTFLPQAIDVVKPGGRLAVIAYHSGEDRIVKQFLRQESRDCICPPQTPTCCCSHRARLKIITVKAVKPSREEVMANPRGRSARLRVAEKVHSVNTFTK